MSSDPALELDLDDRDQLSGLDYRSERQANHEESRGVWVEAIRIALAGRSPRCLAIAEQALKAYPIDPELLLLAALTTTAMGQPERSLALLKRFGKRYEPNKSAMLLTALALAHQEQYGPALTLLRAEKLNTDSAALDHFVGEDLMANWLFGQLHQIRLLGLRALRKAPPRGQGQALPKLPPAKPQAARLVPVVPRGPPSPIFRSSRHASSWRSTSPIPR